MKHDDVEFSTPSDYVPLTLLSRTHRKANVTMHTNDEYSIGIIGEKAVGMGLIKYD